MDELSHVGMTNCWICGEGAEIMIDMKLRQILNKNMGSTPNTVCSDCESKSKDNDAIWLISIKDDEKPPESNDEIWNPYRTGGLVLIKKEAIRRMFAADEFDKSILESVNRNVYFYLSDEQWKIFGLPTPGTEIGPTDE